MAHYAYINSENQVVDVITGVDENDTSNLPSEFSSWEEFYANQREGLDCKRTSYNTTGNTHGLGGTPFRGNYADIGGVYDPVNDVFYMSQPFSSWTISADTNWIWQCPVDFPTDANQEFNTSLPVKNYVWNEENLEWENTHSLIYNTETEIWEVE